MHIVVSLIVNLFVYTDNNPRNDMSEQSHLALKFKTVNHGWLIEQLVRGGLHYFIGVGEKLSCKLVNI